MQKREDKMAKQEFIESKEEMEALLRQEDLGYLGLAGEDQPYVVPLNYAYAEGKILFHCALEGKKLDHIRAHPQVCFTVARQTGRVRAHAGQDPCHVDSDSVICFGRGRVVEFVEERKALLDVFNRRFNPGAEPISQQRAENCGAVEITIVEMTGRREREHGVTYWRHRFA
jgi:nitroimidazol reductase NimA-like FMN-containing flavoprotein (pyridoxamine 5'-phosphate oxidase superfamily)